jgi:hypothetical protein
MPVDSFAYKENVASVQDLLDALIVFATDGDVGWSVAYSPAAIGPSGAVSKLERACLESPNGTAFAHFAAGLNSVPPVEDSNDRFDPSGTTVSRFWPNQTTWASNWQKQANSQYKYVDYLAVSVAEAHSALTVWNDQVGGPFIGATATPDGKGYAEYLTCNWGSSATDPSTNNYGDAGVHVIDKAWFTSDATTNSIMVVISWGSSRFSWMSFGESITKNSVFTGGAHFGAAFPIHGPHFNTPNELGLYPVFNPLVRYWVRVNDAAYEYDSTLYPGRNGWGATFAGGCMRYRAEADVENIDNHLGIGYGVPAFTIASEGDLTSVDGYQRSPVHGAYDAQDGDAVLYDAPLYTQRYVGSVQTGCSMIGCHPMMKLTSLEQYAGGDEMTVATDTYLVFPFFIKDTDLAPYWFTNSNGIDGTSATKWGLADYRPNNCGIGFAIKKPDNVIIL